MQRNRQRAVFDPNAQSRAESSTSAVAPASASAVTPMTMRNRQKKRPKELVEAVARLDTTVDARAQKELIDFIGSIYEAQDLGLLVGLFAQCFLGPPYVDHQMNMAGDILVHYAPYDSVPPMFEGARPLARSGAYAYIEVYDDGTLIPVRGTGTVVVGLGVGL